MTQTDRAPTNEGGRRQPRTFFRGRNYAIGSQLDTFLVCAASGVIINRAILIVLGYPQIGSRNPGGIHISHSIYGGFSMMIAASVALSFLHPNVRWFLAIVGGLGFGWYIDELGKYVSNAGYLFSSALALIYIVFILMYVAFSALAQRAFTPDDAVANALESLKAAALGTLDDRQRRVALRRLERLGPDSSFATRLHELLEDTPASPPRPAGRVRRFRLAVIARYVSWSHRRSFEITLDIFFPILALVTLAGVVGISIDGPGITKPSERIATIAASVAAALILVGLLRLRRSRLAAYRWFDRALMIRILVVQVFLFRQEQFAAVAGLAIDLFVWTMLRSAMAIEVANADHDAIADPEETVTAATS